MIFASVPVLQPPEEMNDSWPTWRGCHDELLIVDNTTDRAWEPLALEEGWSYLTFEKNAGVCASWNAARASFMAYTPRDLDLLLLFSASIAWTDGLAASMVEFQQAANWKGCQSQYGAHAIAWSRRLLEIAGTWDENFVNYYGDNDFFYRGIIDGWLLAGPDAMPNIAINAPVPEDGRAIRATGMVSNTAASGAYYESKWRGPPSEERACTPFDSGLPTWWWSPAVRPALDHFDPWQTRYR